MGRKKLTEPVYRLARVGATWHLTWTDTKGKSQRLSTGEKDETRAKQWRSDYLAGLRSPPPEPSQTIGALMQAYLADITGRPDHHRQEWAWEAMQEHFQHMSVQRITIGDCKEYALKRGKKPGTIIKELGTLRTCINWGRKHGWYKSAPFIWLPPRPQPKSRWLSKDEAYMLIMACEDLHLRTFVILALTTAARKQDILALTWDRVDFAKGRINYITGEQNRKHAAIVPMPDFAREALQEAREMALTDNVIEWNGSPVRDIKKGFRAACAKCDRALGKGSDTFQDVTPHTLRHTAATWMAEAGVPMRVISLYLGHQDERITARVYAKHSPDYLAQAAVAIGGYF